MAALPMRCRKYLAERGLGYDEVEEGGQRGIVLRAMPLPPGRFDATVADILIMLPPGYPDVAPDMFYAMPWLRLVATSTYARCADVPFTFVSQTWQRWSRHSSDWRPGRDGIWTMIKRVEAALELAA